MVRVPDESGSSAAHALWGALGVLGHSGIAVERVPTDNVFAWVWHAYLDALPDRQLFRIRPYGP